MTSSERFSPGAQINNKEFDKAFRDMNSKIPNMTNTSININSSITSIPLSNLTLGGFKMGSNK